MSRADEIARAARVALGPAEVAARTVEAVADDARAARGARRVRTERVRKTVDLAPTRYHDLAALMGDWAIELGVARVTSQDVLDAAVRTVLTDATVADRVRAQVAKILAER